MWNLLNVYSLIGFQLKHVLYRMKTFEFLNEDAVVQQTTETKNSSGILTSFALMRQINLPEYEVVSVTGPSHCRQFVMTCKMNEHVTRGKIY